MALTPLFKLTGWTVNPLLGGTMASQAKVIAATSARLAGVGLVIWFLFVAWRGAWHALAQVNPNLGVALVAAAATLLAATITVMLGRYYERKRDIEA